MSKSKQTKAMLLSAPLALAAIMLMAPYLQCATSVNIIRENYSGVSLPKYPLSGNPSVNLTNVEFKVNILFIGFPANSIDTSEMYKELPTNYTTINRMIYSDAKRLAKYSNFKITYAFSGFESSWQTFGNKFSEYIQNNHREDYAPYWLQEGVTYSGASTNPVEKCWYVDARNAELWIKNNAPPGSFQDGYTILLIDTWHTSPQVTAYYFYNGSVPSVPLPIDPSSSDSQFMMAYGGYYRFLFVDLQAGPPNYADTKNIKPLWLYNLPSQAKDLSRDLGKIVKNTVELRFLPSFLYAPIYRSSYWIDATIFNKDPTLPILFDMNRLLQEYRDFQPHSNFSGEYHVVQIQSDSNLFQAVEAATDVNGITNADQVASYFLSHLSTYAPSHGTDYVLPVFILAGYDFGGLLGRSCSDGNGNPAFVIECLNRKMGGFDLVTEPWGAVGEPYTLNVGWSAWFTDPAMLDKNIMATFEFHLLTGSAKVRIADVYNFNKWINNNYDYNQASFHQVWTLTAGDYQLEFVPPAPGGKYYLIIENTGGTAATFYGVVTTSRIQGFTLTPLTVHETGHSLGLTHPHDGFSWILYQQGLPLEAPGEYTYWLWDFSTTPMTYAACNMRFDQLDRDSINRGCTATLLNETFVTLKNTESKLNQLGFGVIPPAVSSSVNTSISRISEALASFSASSPDYATAASKALEARNAASTAYAAVSASVYDVSLVVKDSFGLAMEGASVSVALANGTVLTAVTDSSGTAIFKAMPYGDYVATASIMGQSATVHFSASQSAGSPIPMTITFSLIVILTIVGIVAGISIAIVVVFFVRRMKRPTPQPSPLPAPAEPSPTRSFHFHVSSAN